MIVKPGKEGRRKTAFFYLARHLHVAPHNGGRVGYFLTGKVRYRTDLRATQGDSRTYGNQIRNSINFKLLIGNELEHF